MKLKSRPWNEVHGSRMALHPPYVNGYHDSIAIESSYDGKILRWNFEHGFCGRIDNIDAGYSDSEGS